MLVAVAGCVAQAEGGEIVRRQPAVDLVVGPQAYHRLPELLRQAAIAPGVVDASFPIENKFDRLPAAAKSRTRARGPSAFVTVQEGCDKFCSFCVVPYTRGASIVASASRRSRRGASARGRRRSGGHVARAKRQRLSRARRGRRRLDAWAPDPGGRARGRDLRVRYTTSHPRDMDENMIEAHRSEPALMPFLHLPVQSGSDRILAAMNRRHAGRDYLKLVENVRAGRAGRRVLVGFHRRLPGETNDDFLQTLALVSDLGFASRVTPSCIRPGPAPPRPSSTTKSTRATRREARRACRRSLRANGAPSTGDGGRGAWRCSVEKPAGATGQSAATVPICRRHSVDAPPDADQRDDDRRNRLARAPSPCLRTHRRRAVQQQDFNCEQNERGRDRTQAESR